MSIAFLDKKNLVWGCPVLAAFFLFLRVFMGQCESIVSFHKLLCMFEYIQRILLICLRMCYSCRSHYKEAVTILIHEQIKSFSAVKILALTQFLHT